ncbi:MAG: 50S ribosomal protein L29 [Oscillospiraceae bacterium]|nr:50S ribosomal protein L29 [Oscillospiraceae bacterium]
MTVKDARELSNSDLKTKLSDYKSELFNLNFQRSVNQLTNPMRIRSVKKSIARILTVMKQKINSSEV